MGHRIPWVAPSPYGRRKHAAIDGKSITASRSSALQETAWHEKTLEMHTRSTLGHAQR